MPHEVNLTRVANALGALKTQRYVERATLCFHFRCKSVELANMHACIPDRGLGSGGTEEVGRLRKRT
jgi:hypothetical protein